MAEREELADEGEEEGERRWSATARERECTLRRNRGCGRTAGDRPAGKPTTASIARFRAGVIACLMAGTYYARSSAKNARRD